MRQSVTQLATVVDQITVISIWLTLQEAKGYRTLEKIIPGEGSALRVEYGFATCDDLLTYGSFHGMQKRQDAISQKLATNQTAECRDAALSEQVADVSWCLCGHRPSSHHILKHGLGYKARRTLLVYPMPHATRDRVSGQHHELVHPDSLGLKAPNQHPIYRGPSRHLIRSKIEYVHSHPGSCPDLVLSRRGGQIGPRCSRAVVSRNVSDLRGQASEHGGPLRPGRRQCVVWGKSRGHGDYADTEDIAQLRFRLAGLFVPAYRHFCQTQLVQPSDRVDKLTKGPEIA